MKKKKIIICILALLLILLLIIIVVSVKNKEASKVQKTNDELNKEQPINNDEIKKAILDSSILEPNNKKQSSVKENENFRLATDIDKANYEITDLKKISDSKKTTITGRIKNNGGSENIILKLEYTGNVNSSSSIEIKKLKVGNSQDFEIKVLNNAATEDYTVYVEYVGE